MRRVPRKLFLLLFVSLLLSNVTRAQNWTRLAQFGGAPQYVSAIYFFDDNLGFVGIYGTTNGPVRRTTNGGQSWQNCITPAIPAPVLIEDIWFRDAQNGWLTFNYGTINNLWKTTDGGMTWNVVTSFPDVGGMTIRQTSHALSITTAIPGNIANTGIYVSSNNGASFQLFNNSDSYAGMDFADDLHGVAAGLYNPFSITNDGGVSWQLLGSTPNIEAFGVYALKGSSTFFAVPEDIFNRTAKNALRSDDYGQTWSSLALPPFRPTGDIKGVMNANGTVLFIQTRYQSTMGGVMRSVDMGRTWSSIGGPNNVSDTRLFVQQCGNRIFVGDTNGSLWVTYNGGDGINFACGVTDSVSLTATLCDSISQMQYLHNPHPGDSVFVIDATIIGASALTSSHAFGFDSVPRMYSFIKDSIGYVLHWVPRRISDTALTMRATVRFVTFDKKTGVFDTILIPAKLFGKDVYPTFTAATSLRENGEACLAHDTSILIQNLGCDTLWINASQFSQNTNWSLLSQLPIAILPGQSASVSLRVLPVSPNLADTLRLSLHYFRHDTLATIFMSGKAVARDPFSSPVLLHLDSALICATTDTLLSLLDTLCGTMSILSVKSDSAQWSFYTADRKQLPLPLVLQKDLGFPLRVEYNPSYLQPSRDTLRITYQYFDSTFVRRIPLQGIAKQTSGFDYSHVFDVGAHSICTAFDTTLTLQNQTCAKALIDSISLSSAFTILDPFPLTVDTNGSVTLHIRFSPKAVQNYVATARFSFTEYELPATDSLILMGRGIVEPPTFTITPARRSIDISLTECDKPDTITFTISNPSCDSLAVQTYSIRGTAGAVVKVLADQMTPIMLAGSSTARISLIVTTVVAGSYTGDLHFELSSLDTAIPINVNIARVPKTIVMDTTPIDLGDLKPCETRNIAIPYTNTSCVKAIAEGWKMAHYGDGFQVYAKDYQPLDILPGATDTFHLTFDGHHTGLIYDTILIGFNTDDNQGRRIPVRTYVPSIDSVFFTASMPAALSSNQQFTTDVSPDRATPGKGIYSISGNLLYPTNDFDLVSIKAPSNLSLTSTGPNGDNITQRIRFTLSSANPISLDPNIPILSVKFRTLLTDSISYTITLDSMLLNGDDPDFAHCTLAAGGSIASASFSPACGDSIYIQALRNESILFASEPSPNPASSKISVELRSDSERIVNIDLIDALGRTARSRSFLLPASELTPYYFEVNDLATGSYTIVTRSGSLSPLARHISVVH